MLKVNMLNHQFAKFTKFMECGFNVSIGTLNSFVRVFTFGHGVTFLFILVSWGSEHVISCLLTFRIFKGFFSHFLK